MGNRNLKKKKVKYISQCRNKNVSKYVQYKHFIVYPFQVSTAHSILLGSRSHENVNTRHRIPEIRNVSLYETVMQAWAKQVRCSFTIDIA